MSGLPFSILWQGTVWCTSIWCLLKGVLQYSTLTCTALQSHTLRRTALSCLQISAGHFHKAKKSPAFKATGMMTNGQQTSPVHVLLQLPTTGELIARGMAAISQHHTDEVLHSCICPTHHLTSLCVSHQYGWCCIRAQSAHHSESARDVCLPHNM